MRGQVRCRTQAVDGLSWPQVCCCALNTAAVPSLLAPSAACRAGGVRTSLQVCEAEGDVGQVGLVPNSIAKAARAHARVPAAVARATAQKGSQLGLEAAGAEQNPGHIPTVHRLRPHALEAALPQQLTRRVVAVLAPGVLPKTQPATNPSLPAQHKPIVSLTTTQC